MLGKLGGASRTDAKVAASRANGAKGGRPLRIELNETEKAVIAELLAKHLAKLEQFRQDDPAWSDSLWQKSIDECKVIARKVEDSALAVDFKKTEVIGLIQLLTERIAREERAKNKSQLNLALDELLVGLHSVAQYLDSFVTSSDQPSIFQHYLKEAHGRF